MSIIYGFIGKQPDIILVDSSNSFGNFQQIAKNIMNKVQPNTHHSYLYNDKYQFHYINEGGVTFMCLTEAPYQQKYAAAFLEDIKKEFFDMFSENQINLAINYSLSTPFIDTLKKKMEHYSTIQNDQKLQELQQSVNNVRHLMLENIDRLIDREEKVELLVKKTSNMNFQAFDIKNQASQYREQSRWSKIKTKVGIGAAVVITVGGAIFLF